MKKEENSYGEVYINGVKIGKIIKPVPIRHECRIGYAMTTPYAAPMFPKRRIVIGPIEFIKDK